MIISVLLLGFSCQMVVPAVRSEMEFKEELPKATTGAMVVVMTVYGLAGLTGYFGFGNAVEGNVQVSMLDPETGTMLLAGALLACSVVANLTVTYPIVMHCVNRACEAAMKTGYSLPVRLCLFAFTVFGALVCPYFLEMLGILGSFNGVFAGIGIPLACKWKLYSEDGIPKEINRCYLFIRDGMIAALSLIALFLGSYQAVSDMSAAFASGGGNPFATFNDPMSPPREPNPLSERALIF